MTTNNDDDSIKNGRINTVTSIGEMHYYEKGFAVINDLTKVSSNVSYNSGNNLYSGDEFEYE